MKNIFILQTDKPTRLYEISSELTFSVANTMHQYGVGRNIYITNDEEIKKRDWVIKKYETKFPESKANEVLQVYNIDSNNGYLPNGNYYNFNNYLTIVVYDRPFQGSNDYDISRKTFENEFKKIILTTDQDLIKDGVQAIPDDFLEWFVKNPSCEVVEVKYGCQEQQHWGWALIGKPCTCKKITPRIIIPKEELFKHKFKVLTTEEVMKGRSSAYEFIDFEGKLEEVRANSYIDFAKSNEDVSPYSFIAGFDRGVKFAKKELYTKEDMLEAFNAGNKRGHSGYPNTDNWTQPTFEDFLHKIKTKKQ